MKQVAGKAELALTYNNYGNLMMDQGKYKESVIYLDSAIMVAYANRDTYKVMLYKSNLAASYTFMDIPQKAINIYNECIAYNLKYNYPDRLVYNYAGIADAYEKIGNMVKVNEYTHNYYQINDSIKGAEVKLKIAKLESENEINKREIKLEQNAKLLAIKDSRNERLLWILAFMVLGALITAYAWYYRYKSNIAEKLKNENYLNDLIFTILKKNAIIANQESQLSAYKLKETGIPDYFIGKSEDLEEHIFNTSILTEEDYTLFKSYFEKSNPGLLIKIRRAYPDITAAEERLFLLLKSNLKNSDIAETLGISSASVKKTRNRLRKRLNLNEETDLNDFVSAF